jgi:DNA-binding SARP family transcriptional activator
VRDGRALKLPASKKTRAGRDPTIRAALRWSLTKMRSLLDEKRLAADRERVLFDACGPIVDLLFAPDRSRDRDRRSDGPEEALRWARARVTIDPLSEAAHVQVVRLLGELGRTREALKQYENCRRILESELGARPSPDLERALLAPRDASVGAA